MKSSIKKAAKVNAPQVKAAKKKAPLDSPANFSYHRQDNDRYCGAACLQMILQESGDLETGSLYKDQAYINSQFQPVAGWRAAPEELVRVLNQVQGAANWAKVEATCDPADPEVAGMALLTSLIHSASADKGAAIAPVRQFDHWVVMTGVGKIKSLLPDPTGGGKHKESAYEEWHISVNDPWPPLDLTTPVQHFGHAAGICESGECKISAEIWGPVFVSDFLEQRRLIATTEYCLGVAGTTNGAPPPVDPRAFTTARKAVPYGTPMIDQKFLYKIAQQHAKHLKTNLPNSIWAKFNPTGLSADDIQVVSSPNLQSRYPDRYQLTVDGNVTVMLPPPSLPLVVEVTAMFELCAYTGVLSRLRIVPKSQARGPMNFKWLNVSNFALK